MPTKDLSVEELKESSIMKVYFGICLLKKLEWSLERLFVKVYGEVYYITKTSCRIVCVRSLQPGDVGGVSLVLHGESVLYD